jgi:2-polyprenyl-3-methyl-5-hydroxy-6-metoxy-1,4-benzoquinol methylase
MAGPSISATASASQERFEFGKNWQHFLLSVDERRILDAENSLQDALAVANLQQKTFLDVGCGSGLFSLAARRLGAAVTSFDYDPESVACAQQLKKAFFSGDAKWRIDRGSALDQSYLGQLGMFDVVYSWGVLHHTGAMWEALGNIVQLVKPGGLLFISIYNDQGRKSDVWRFIKRTYNRTPENMKFLIAWPIGVAIWAGVTVLDLTRLRKPRVFSRVSTSRGMSFWTDIIDWVGGYPFEVASVNQIEQFYEQRGFRLEKLVNCGRKLGCNEFVLRNCQNVRLLSQG